MFSLNYLLVLLLVSVQVIYALDIENSSAYCTYNETIVVNTKVQKRVTQMQRKFSFRSLTYKNVPVEKVVEEIVPHTSIRKVVRCCEGYIRQTMYGTCVPYCEKNCTVNAACVQPNKCQCHEGFMPNHDADGQLTCVPLGQTTIGSSTLVPDTSTEQSVSVSGIETDIPSTSVVSRISTRNLPVDCTINGCPDNADCQYNSSMCECKPGFEWRQITTTDSNEDSLCLAIIERVSTMKPTTNATTSKLPTGTYKYIVILIFILGVVLCAVLLLKIVRIVLLRRREKFILTKAEGKQ